MRQSLIFGVLITDIQIHLYVIQLVFPFVILQTSADTIIEYFSVYHKAVIHFFSLMEKSYTQPNMMNFMAKKNWNQTNLR